MKECGKPATHRVVWASDVLFQCEEHAKQIATVGSVIGYRPVIDIYIGDKTCSQNVKDEAVEPPAKEGERGE